MNDETNRDEELINQIAELYRPGKNQELLRQTIWDMVNHILDLDWLYDVIIQRAKEILDTPHIFLGLAEPDTDENKKRGIEFKKGIGLFNQKISEFDILAESILNDSSTSIIVSQERTSTIVQTMIGAPLKSGGHPEIIGMIGGAYEGNRIFRSDEITLFGEFIDFAGLILDKAQVFDRIQSLAIHNRVLEKFVTVTNSTLSLPALLEQVCDELRQLFNTPQVEIVLLDSELMKELPYTQVIETSETLILVDTIVVPLILRKDVIGIMSLEIAEAKEVDTEQIVLLETIGRQTAGAIEKIQLYSKFQ